MNITDEALLISFYSHKLHVEDPCKDVENISQGMINLCYELFACLLDINCCEIVKIIRKLGCLFNISHGDIPQFSNLDDCTYKVPILVKDCGIEDLTYTQLGFMLRTTPRKEGADMKYGENQSKTAAQMGLCSIEKSRIYPSNLGIAFCNLDNEKQKKLLPKLILFIPYIFNQYASNADYEKIIASVSFLAETTQKRRLTNIWSLISQVNQVLPYEFQIIRY